jgi:hypothetical protein
MNVPVKHMDEVRSDNIPWLPAEKMLKPEYFEYQAVLYGSPFTRLLFSHFLGKNLRRNGTANFFRNSLGSVLKPFDPP